jgi:hypothetical protein
MLPAPVPGDDMVYGKLPAFLTTVLAGVMVASENFKPGQLSTYTVGALNH